MKIFLTPLAPTFLAALIATGIPNHVDASQLMPTNGLHPAVSESTIVPSAGVAGAADSERTYAVQGATACDLELGPSRLYDDGDQTSIALNTSGLALEFHRHKNNTEMWYRVGKSDGATVTWGASRYSGGNGYLPSVALSKEGYVIVVHSNNNFKSGTDLYYRVGKINPDGDQNQTIAWLTDFVHWDAGFHAAIAINDRGVIVGVHEAGRGGTGLYYRVGHLRNPAGGDYTVQWDSTPWGVHYEDGINPSIAINNHNQVVEAHQVTGETLLHYRRGNLTGGTINFAESRRYDNHAEQPAVALLDNGLVLEVHSLGGLISRTGWLSLSNSTDIEWSTPIKVDDDGFVAYPALATNGTDAIVTYRTLNDLSFSQLFVSVARICASSSTQLF